MGLIFISGCTGKNYESFAQCLTDKGAVMYGTEWCSHCQDQKKLFGNSFKKINFVDCDKSKLICDQEGVTGYPSWKINDKIVQGQKSLEVLSKLTGCKLEVKK